MSVYFVRFLSHEWGGDAARVALVAEMQPMYHVMHAINHPGGGYNDDDRLNGK